MEYLVRSEETIEEISERVGYAMPFFACDTFRGHAVVDEALDGRHRVGKQFNSSRGDLAQRVARYLRKYDFVEVIEGDIQQTASRFDGRYVFGMVHVDVDVYPVTKFCLEFFAPRVVTGAMIVVDDYGFTTCKGAKKAVDDFVAERSREFRALHLLSGQAVLIRVQ
jgi:O-methyltransferase